MPGLQHALPIASPSGSGLWSPVVVAKPDRHPTARAILKRGEVATLPAPLLSKAARPRLRESLASVCILALPTVALGACTGGQPVAAPTPAPRSVTNEPDDAATRAHDADVAAVRGLASAAGHLTRSELLQLSLPEQARLLTPCARLSWGDFYCLGLGFSDDRPDFRALLATPPATPSGDLPLRDWIAQRAAMPPRERLAQQRAESEDAVLALDKARSLARN